MQRRQPAQSGAAATINRMEPTPQLFAELLASRAAAAPCFASGRGAELPLSRSFVVTELPSASRSFVVTELPLPSARVPPDAPGWNTRVNAPPPEVDGMT